MKNPFLSDRNIFSKVVNPARKADSQKEENGPAPNPVSRTVEAPPARKEPMVGNYIPQGSSKREEAEHSSKVIGNNSATKSAQQRPQYGSTYQTAPQQSNFMQRPTQGQQDFQERRPLPRHDTIVERPHQRQQVISRPGAQQLNERPPGKYANSNFYSNSTSREEDCPPVNREYGRPSRGNPQAPPAVQSPTFEEYERSTGQQQYSPIPHVAQRSLTNESEFLNIDALGDDLNKFLAQSKNQDELCKLLGINKQNERPQVQVPTPPPNMEVYQSKKSSASGSGYSREQEPFESFQPTSRPQYQPQPQKVQNDPAPVPAIFKKQRRVADVEPQASRYGGPEQSLHHPQRVQQKEHHHTSIIREVERKPSQNNTMRSVGEERPTFGGQYMPTFNYQGLDAEGQTVSRFEDPTPKPRQKNESPSHDSPLAVPKADVEVFDYSQQLSRGSSPSIEQQIQDELMQQAVNGRYRTFLTACEKIVAVECKLQPL